MNKEKIAISACLLGVNFKYNGLNNFNPKLLSLFGRYQILPICPEVISGMSIPRYSSEIKNDKVININGEDVSEYFILGAKRTYEFLKKNNCKKIILKDGSPSCGISYIYDGSFSKTRIRGFGYTVKYLKEHFIDVIIINGDEEVSL